MNIAQSKNRKPIEMAPVFSHWMAKILSLSLFGLMGCRGDYSESPPIHPNLNMDFQTNYKPQKENPFFEDKRAMRPLVPGVVPRGHLKDDLVYYEGRVGDTFVNKNPIVLTMPTLQRGRERFNIYCVPCHGGAGEGNGIVIKKGMIQPPKFSDDRIVDMPNGQLYDSIINGVRGNMPSYKSAIPPEDRWAIVHYIRALQLAHRAPIEMVPNDIAISKGWKK